jgi:uroporphyrinogen-III synthase
MKILLTRPRDYAEISAARLSDAGLEAVILPLMRYLLVEEDAIPERRFDAVIFTSAAAPDMLSGRSDFSIEANTVSGRAYCVGAATAAAAVAAGFEAVVPDRADAGGLISALDADIASVTLPARPVLLHASGRHISRDLASSLPGVELVRTVIYEAVPVDPGHDKLAAAIEAAANGGVFLYSARSAAQIAFLCEKYGLVKELCGLTMVGISEKVAQTMPKWPDARIVVADRPDEASMIAALRAATGVGSKRGLDRTDDLEQRS